MRQTTKLVVCICPMATLRVQGRHLIVEISIVMPCRRVSPKGKAYDTRLDRFLRREGLALDALAAAAGISRQNLGALRSGRGRPREDTIARLVVALRRMLNRRISANDLFYLGEQQDDHTREAEQFRARVSGVRKEPTKP